MNLLDKAKLFLRKPAPKNVVVKVRAFLDEDYYPKIIVSVTRRNHADKKRYTRFHIVTAERYQQLTACVNDVVRESRYWVVVPSENIMGWTAADRADKFR